MKLKTGLDDFSDHERGQVLAIFAIFLIVLMGMAALAVDISGALSARRFYRTAADAASLAGAQDLQQGTSRTVGPTEQQRARTDALNRLVSLLGATSGSGCNPSADIVDCQLPGTGYRVSIKTPSPTCVDCSPNRSVQVTVRNPNYSTTFARILGQTTWNVGSTSVAGLTFGKSYTIITLRPPRKLGSTFDVRDITLDGGTVVTVSRGDVGSNANMEYSGLGSLLVLNPDYDMFYFPGPAPFDTPQWGTNPTAQRLTSLIQDPNYRYPAMSGVLGTEASHTYDDGSEASHDTGGAVTRADVSATCDAERLKVDATRYVFMATMPQDRVYCYEPGVYDTTNPKQLSVGTGNVALLKPGAYYMKSGLAVRGYLLGGYEAGSKGVALMFDECNTSCKFDGNNATVIALNAGTKFPPTYAGGAAATAARDWDNQLVETSGPDSPNPPLPITLFVKKDPTCFVPTSPPWQEPSACDALRDKTINLAGSGGFVLEGVQYMPTDNVEISGTSSSNGRVGQIISWTLKYSGGVRINQEGPANEGVGILRLDAACTAPSTPCNSP
jgi:Flp pilus assembly protein TadG